MLEQKPITEAETPIEELMTQIDHEIGIRSPEVGTINNATVFRLVKELRKRNAQVDDLEQQVCDFKAAAMLDVGGDPDGVTPAIIEKEITALRSQVASLEAERNDLMLIVDVGTDADPGTAVARMRVAIGKAKSDGAERMKSAIIEKVKDIAARFNAQAEGFQQDGNVEAHASRLEKAQTSSYIAEQIEGVDL